MSFHKHFFHTISQYLWKSHHEPGSANVLETGKWKDVLSVFKWFKPYCQNKSKRTGLTRVYRPQRNFILEPILFSSLPPATPSTLYEEMLSCKERLYILLTAFFVCCGAKRWANLNKALQFEFDNNCCI